uniref:Uncharacterized protein n=1 Tax=Cucumis sativus TaxID=3659 RepID=A0A0A0K0J6_CUCSA
MRVILTGGCSLPSSSVLPTEISNEEKDLEGSTAQAERTPLRQQPSDLFSGDASGMRSRMTGLSSQECGMSNLNNEQFPCSVAKAPFIDQMTSPLVHVHPNFQPGFSTCRN